MKWPTVKRMKEHKCLHIEAEGCIVNIRQGLTDRLGRSVTSIEVLPDKYAGEPKWKLYGLSNTRVVKLKSKRI